MSLYGGASLTDIGSLHSFVVNNESSIYGSGYWHLRLIKYVNLLIICFLANKIEVFFNNVAAINYICECKKQFQ